MFGLKLLARDAVTVVCCASTKEMDLHLVDQEVIALARAFGTYQGHPKCRATIDVSRVVSALQ